MITDHLDRRPRREPDYAGESRALSTLAEEMAQDPAAVLQKVAELAIELCRADSVGISVLEPGGDAAICRWHAASGAAARVLHGTMPREASPCGIVVEPNELLLIEGPEGFFPATEASSPGSTRVFLPPWSLDGKPAGTVWLMKHTPDGRFDAEDARLLKNLSRFASAACQVVTALELARSGRQQLERKVEEGTRALDHLNENLREREALIRSVIAHLPGRRSIRN